MTADIFPGTSSRLSISSLYLQIDSVVPALISSRYKRLRVFLVTVRLDMSFDTFEILHENHAAYTLYHMPITFKTVAAVVHLIVVEVLLLALAGDPWSLPPGYLG